MQKLNYGAQTVLIGSCNSWARYQSDVEKELITSADSDELMEISEAELEAAIADTTGMPEPERETLLNLIEKGLAVDSGMRRNGQWQCISPRPW